jgi:cytochrome P450
MTRIVCRRAGDGSDAHVLVRLQIHMGQELSGEIAIVTGGHRGIGRASVALSRFDDVKRGFADHETLSSAHGGVLEAIKSNFQVPKGVFIMEDPPMHTAHRGVLLRVFSPRKMNALEPKIRQYCAEVLDPLVGGDRFDFVGDLGAKVPMRVIGMLLGIPEQDHEAIRQRGDARLSREPGKPAKYRDNHLTDDAFFGEYIDWRAEHPSDDLIASPRRKPYRSGRGRKPIRRVGFERIV